MITDYDWRAPATKKKRIRRGVGGLGDSITANCHSIAATAYSSEAYGYLGGLASKIGVQALYTDNQGKVGDHSGQFMPRLPLALASQTADLWFVPSRTNDSTTPGMTLADSKANIMKIVTSFLSTPGKYVVIGTGMPRFGTKALTGQPLLDAIAYKDWVLSYVSQFTLVVNTWDGFTQAMTVDDLHPNILGQDFISSKLVPVVLDNFEFVGVPLPTDTADIYSAIRPFGCLNVNPLMLGTSGTIPASVNAVAGSVLADGYKCSGSGLAGVTTAWSKEPAQYGESQVIQLAGNMTAAGGYLYVQPTANITLASLTAGDLFEMVSLAEVSGSSRGILAWEAELLVTKPVAGTSQTVYFRAMDKYQEPFTLPANVKMMLETQRAQYEGAGIETVVTSRMGLYLATGVALDSKVKVAQYGVRKI